MSELEILWERLRIMNRSLEEDLRQNEADSDSAINEDHYEQLFLQYVVLRARQEQINEIMEIVEGMMENE